MRAVSLIPQGDSGAVGHNGMTFFSSGTHPGTQKISEDKTWCWGFRGSNSRSSKHERLEVVQPYLRAIWALAAYFLQRRSDGVLLIRPTPPRKTWESTALSIFGSLLPLSFYANVDSLKDLLRGKLHLYEKICCLMAVNPFSPITTTTPPPNSISSYFFIFLRAQVCSVTLSLRVGWLVQWFNGPPRSRDMPREPTGWANSGGRRRDTRRPGYLCRRAAWRNGGMTQARSP